MGRYKPPATPAEAAEREQARAAKLEQLHTTLAEQVGAIRNGQDWQRWLQVAATFPSYSLNNVLLIAAQRPDATAVAGFGAWKALGRQVDKGSKGIAILAPMVRRPKAGQPGDGAAGEAAAGSGSVAGAPEGDAAQDPAGSRRSIGGFKVVHVFDVAQTSGQPLPERPRPVLLAGQAPQGLWEVLAEQVRARGFALRRGDCGGANGLTHYLERTVTVRADVDDAQAVKTLAHELGHVLLHDPTGRATASDPGAALAAAGPALPPEAAPTSAGQCRGRWEVEAESVAYLVASVHGMDTGAYTFAYVAGWAGEVSGAEVDQVVRGTAQRVLAAAKVVLAGTEHLLDEPAQVSQALGQGTTLAADAARGAERTTSAAAATTAAAAVPTVERLLEVHALAVDFYSSRLHSGSPDARRAVALLTERGVDRDAAGAARLGYAPRTWTGLVDHLRSAGVDDTELRASGLVLESSRGTLVDRFRDRVIFPVDTQDGQTVALLGRAVDEGATDRHGAPVPKYLNSPSTALYSKGEHLYGLGAHAAQAIAAGAQPVLVEGPMDVLAVNRAASPPGGGTPTQVAVAPCGTALTEQQVKLLDTVTGGLAERGIVTALDGDDAGRQASLRAYDLLRQVRAWPSALDLPAGQDPAGLATEHGAAGLHAALRAAVGKPLADLVVDERIARHPLQWTEGQVAAGRDAAAAVATMPTEHVGRQVARVSALTGLDTATVSGLVVDAVTSPSRAPSPGRAHGTVAARSHSPAATARASRVAAHPVPPSRAVVASSQSAAQRARAGFPVPLHAGLRPPAPAALGTSPPAPPEPHHRSRTA
jgi:DNA primase